MLVSAVFVLQCKVSKVLTFPRFQLIQQLCLFFWVWQKIFMDSHGSLTAPVGNDCGGLYRSDDTVPCERFTISLVKNATKTVRFCLSQHLISLAIVDEVSLISCGASSLASRHKDFLIRIRAASQHCSQLQLSWATIMRWISVFLPKCNWTYLHKPCPTFFKEL